MFLSPIPWRRLSALLLCALLPFGGAAAASNEASKPAPYGVAAANPLAARAGLRVLDAGGSAVDAAIAIQAVLGLVEPQSSGLGGGSFMLFFDASRQRVQAYDGREFAPASAGPDWFLENGKPLSFPEAVISGHATGVPGAVAMLGLAHAQHGHLPWRNLFADAEKLAQDGFIVSPRLARFIASTDYPQANTANARRYFTRPDGSRYKAGDLLRNPAYAQTLKRLAWGGAKSFYQGRNARAIVNALAQAPRPSGMTLADIAAYRPYATEPLCQPYRQLRICTASPPSSGVALLQALALLQHTDIAQRGSKDPHAWMLLVEAQRLMYADRDQYVADPAFVSVPVAGLLDPQYIAARAALIGERPAALVGPGLPPAAAPRGADRSQEPGGTSHLVIVDKQGNVVSMTTTVESVFGSGRMAEGYFLNNQLTDFSFSPTTADGLPVANAVAGRKRPRSSMAPVIIFDAQGNFVAALGSPGGSAILAYNLKSIVGTFDWGLSMQDAFNLPNVIARGNLALGELEGFEPDLLRGLLDQGVKLVQPRGEQSGLHGLMRLPDGQLSGGADKRREGVVLIR